MFLRELSITLCDFRLQKSEKSSVVISRESRDENVNRGNLRKCKKVNYAISSSEESEDSSDEIKHRKRRKRKTSKSSKYGNYSTSSSEQSEDSFYDIKNRKHKKINARKSSKYVNYATSSSEESQDSSDEIKHRKHKLSSDEEEDDDSDSFSIYKANSHKNKREKEGRKNSKKELSPIESPKELSSYEQMIAKNRAEKMAVLKSLQIDEIKFDIKESMNTMKARKSEIRKANKAKRNAEPPVLRKSSRIPKMDIDFNEDALYKSHILVKQGILPEMTFQHALQSDDYEDFVKDIDICSDKNVSENKESKFCPYERSDLKNLTLSENNIARLAPVKICDMAWYPSAEQSIVVTGSMDSNLCIWNTKSHYEPYRFKVHTAGISCLKFNPYNHAQLFTSSLDGSLHCGDFSKQTFEQMYKCLEGRFTYFDFLSKSTIVIGKKGGELAILDNRIREKCCEKTRSYQYCSIQTVDVHPVNKYLFLASSRKGFSLWDLRKMKPSPVVDQHQKSVVSAYFSPVTGNSILTTAVDNICIFDSTELTEDMELTEFMKHKNYKSPSICRATWLPNSEEAFVVGNILYPNKIEVYDRNMVVYHSLMYDNPTGISSVNVFHPYIPALATANSNGRVMVFT